MPRASFTPRYPARLAGRDFAQDQWRLLVQLPAEIMIATIALQGDGQRRTVAEGLAGLDAIAAGRGSDSDLVREVVAAIYAEPEDDRPEPEAHQTDPTSRRTTVLVRCRQVAEILRAGADPADAAAYRHWVQQVAVRVFGASRSGGLLGLAGEAMGPPERRFLDELATALA